MTRTLEQFLKTLPRVKVYNHELRYLFTSGGYVTYIDGDGTTHYAEVNRCKFPDEQPEQEKDPSGALSEDKREGCVDDSFYCESCDYHKALCKCEKFKPLPEYTMSAVADQNRAINAILRRLDMILGDES